MIGLRAVVTALGVAIVLAGTVRADARNSTPAAAASRTAQEARFLRSVDERASANRVTSDLPSFAGTHVDYICAVHTVVQPGLILGQCGSRAEPIDLFVRLPTAGLRAGERFRILGIMEEPAMWTDVFGHTVYYAFLRAVFVDPLPRVP